MKKILLFAGTTEGRRLSECLSDAGIFHTVCVATEYGKVVMTKSRFATVLEGRMDEQAIRTHLQEHLYAAVVDATHPYATVVTEQIKGALKGMEIPYLRLKRKTGMSGEDSGKSGCPSDPLQAENRGGELLFYFPDAEACARALEQIDGNVLLTTGSKELAPFCRNEELKKRLYVRVLPSIESLTLCMEQGLVGKQILALQGPFSAELNEAMLCQYHIRCLVTKESGKAGGFEEKWKAAERARIPLFVIGRPCEENGDSFGEICKKLTLLCGQRITPRQTFRLTLAGIGMGSTAGMTKEVLQAIEQADILLGAERMIAPYHARLEKHPFYKSEQIIPYLEAMQTEFWAERERSVVILFSGDSGFYSGASALYQALAQEIEDGRLAADLSLLPGISSVSYLASKVGVSYQDAVICSMHGKVLHNLARKIRQTEKVFLLLSGKADLHKLGNLLTTQGLEHCTVWAGFHLSYPEQKILRLCAEECMRVEQEGLYTCLILNPRPEGRRVTHGLSDRAFLRDQVPMTKEEVREVSICKLHLKEDSVVYDIGSGTGSIAMEIAGLSDSIMVYAVEQKEKALSLVRANKEQFGLENIRIVGGVAPEALLSLPAPTHAFIGGSSGNMKEILAVLYEKNPHMRVVINAISMETICELREVLLNAPIRCEEVVQMQVSRSKEVGAYHLMQAENPVWICAFEFCEEAMQEESGTELVENADVIARNGMFENTEGRYET